MTQTGVVIGQQQGHVPSRGVGTVVVNDDNLHLIGIVGCGQRVQIQLIRDTTDVLVDVMCTPNIGEWLSGEAGVFGAGQIISTDQGAIELYDPNGGGFGVFVKKHVPASAHFIPILSPVENNGRGIGRKLPGFVAAKEEYLGPGSEAVEVAILKPVGLKEGDLMVAFIGNGTPGAANPTIKYTGGAADTGWSYMGKILDGQTPTIRAYFKCASAYDEATATGWTWYEASGTYVWGGVIVALRYDAGGSTPSLGDYGMGWWSTAGFPAIWNGTALGGKTGETSDVSFLQNIEMQLASLNVDETVRLWGAPLGLIACFAAGDAAAYGPGGAIFQAAQTTDPVADPKAPYSMSAAKSGAGNEMLTVFYLTPCFPDLKLSAVSYFNNSPFTWQGAGFSIGVFG